MIISAPKVIVEPNELTIVTEPGLRLLTLFSFCRKVSACRNPPMLHIETRSWWGTNTSTTSYTYDQISHLDYTYSKVTLPKGEVQAYTISLVLHQHPSKPITLWQVTEAGRRGISGVLAALFAGNGGEDGMRRIVDLLCDYTGKTLGSADVKNVLAQSGYSCIACGRANAAGRVKCAYCGGVVEAITGEMVFEEVDDDEGATDGQIVFEADDDGGRILFEDPDPFRSMQDEADVQASALDALTQHEDIAPGDDASSHL